MTVQYMQSTILHHGHLYLLHWYHLKVHLVQHFACTCVNTIYYRGAIMFSVTDVEGKWDGRQGVVRKCPYFTFTTPPLSLGVNCYTTIDCSLPIANRRQSVPHRALVPYPCRRHGCRATTGHRR